MMNDETEIRYVVMVNGERVVPGRLTVEEADNNIQYLGAYHKSIAEVVQIAGDK